jgi:hypothetical protein
LRPQTASLVVGDGSASLSSSLLVCDPQAPCARPGRILGPAPRPSFPQRAAIPLVVLLVGGLATGTGCGHQDGPRVSAPATTPAPAGREVVFTDVTQAAGIGFVHNSGAFGRKYLPETMGSGLAFLDYDGDGRQDLFFVNGADWPEKRRRTTTQALYRNRGDGTFEEVTRKAGLAVEMYGIGVAAADFDNDGDVDLFINALGPDRLFRNRGDGTFEDVTQRAGVSDPAFGSSAAWLDYDRDGRLDLFVCNYVLWSPKEDIFCTLDGVGKSYCTPESYRGATNRLFRNRGDGTFEDVTRRTGVFDPTGKSLGVVAFDYDGDGLPDLAVANDTQPNFLYRNRGDGTFAETGRTAGIAFSEEGKARGAMGIDAADYDGSGRESLVIGNFSNEMLALYHNEGRGLFIDDAAMAGIGQPSLLTLAFGCFFFDFDLDGLLDLFVANGHVENDINRVQPSVTYAEPPHLFRGVGGGRFEQADARAGPDFKRPIVGRGAAYADYDGDGDLDIAVSTNNGPALLLRNDGGNAGPWLRLRLVGKKSNRDGIGAVVRLRAGGIGGQRTVRSAASYASQSELPLTFGLGSVRGGDPLAADLQVTWPDGAVQSVTGLAAGRLHVIEEPPLPAASSDTLPGSPGFTSTRAARSDTPESSAGPGAPPPASGAPPRRSAADRGEPGRPCRFHGAARGERGGGRSGPDRPPGGGDGRGRRAGYGGTGRLGTETCRRRAGSRAGDGACRARGNRTPAPPGCPPPAAGGGRPPPCRAAGGGCSRAADRRPDRRATCRPRG